MAVRQLFTFDGLVNLFTVYELLCWKSAFCVGVGIFWTMAAALSVADLKWCSIDTWYPKFRRQTVQLIHCATSSVTALRFARSKPSSYYSHQISFSCSRMVLSFSLSRTPGTPAPVPTAAHLSTGSSQERGVYQFLR